MTRYDRAIQMVRLTYYSTPIVVVNVPERIQLKPYYSDKGDSHPILGEIFYIFNEHDIESTVEELFKTVKGLLER